jgi:type I restriction enzyme S subunit
LNYASSSSYFIHSVIINSNGVSYPAINSTTLGTLNIVVPPVEEQNQIVEYIKTQSQKINHFIAKKQQFIALLKEQRQSVINEAVTKGINKNVKLTDSGIKWLGNIPEHWQVKRIKNISSVISKGTTPSTMGADTIENGNIRFLKAENLYTNEVSLFPEFFIDEKTDQMLFRSRLKENDILLVIAGATIGRIGIVKKECIPANTNQAVCFIRPDNIEPEYLLIWMQCSYFYNVLWFNANQSAQPNIAMGKISNFNVAYPPLSEQTQIVNYIKTETVIIDTAIAKTLKEIQRCYDSRGSDGESKF